LLALRATLRRAAADGDTYHVVMTDNPAASRAVWSDRDLFALEDLTPEDIEVSCEPSLLGIDQARER